MKADYRYKTVWFNESGKAYLKDKYGDNVDDYEVSI